MYFRRLQLDLNSEHGNINQEGRGSRGSQYVAVAVRREPQQLFQNGSTVAGVIRCGSWISDSFSACQRAFSSKHSSESCHRVRRECHDIPRSQSLVPVVWNWSHKCHRFSTVGQAISIIRRTVPIWPQVTTIEKVLLAVECNQIFRLCKQQGHGSRHRAPGSSKMASTNWCTGGICVSMWAAIVWRSDCSVDSNPECVVCWFDVMAELNIGLNGKFLRFSN
jgi:hypothetical protein